MVRNSLHQTLPLQNRFEPIVKYSKMFVCDLSNQISLGGQQREQRGISPFFLWRVEKRIEILIEISLCHCRVHSVLWAPPHTILKHSVRIWYKISASTHYRSLLKYLKYGFCKKSLRKNATLTSWTLFFHKKVPV